MLAIALITIPAMQAENDRQSFSSQVMLALGINFLSGAVGAALFELLIRQPRDNEHQAVTRADLKAALTAGYGTLPHVETLRALEQAAVHRVYATRGHAYAAMAASLRVAGTHQIRVLGVTLSDFVRAGEGSPWSVIEGYVNGNHPPPEGSTKLQIRVMLSDPHEFGARLFVVPRPGGGGHPRVSTLEEDIANVSAKLRQLQQMGRSSTAVELEFRFCRATPAYFLCGTDATMYVQPYYLSQTASSGAAMPVFQFSAEAGMYDGMTQHFEALWTYASVGSEEVLTAKSVGVSAGAHESGLVEVFTNGARARDRMVWLLNNARRRVWIQGVSLVPILTGALEGAFEEAARREGMDIRVLLLAPECETAHRKTFTLYQKDGIVKKDRTVWEAYLADGTQHRDSTTFDNISRSIGWFTNLAKRLPEGRMSVRLTDTVESFILLADDALLLEPYHFGDGTRTKFPTQTPLQLAEDMPLLEFRKPDSLLFPRGASRSEPVGIFESHFERVADNFSQDAKRP